jgi:hypothetical protein
MQKILIFFIIIIIGVLSILAAQLSGLINLGLNNSNDITYSNKGVYEVICDSEVARPLNGLGQPPEITRVMLPAGVDFEEGTGWYTGEYAISTNRKGSLKVDGAILTVSRPAMFSRYGTSIQGEYFTIDRQNGEFKQWLAIEGDKKLYIISGKCKKSSKSPN